MTISVMGRHQDRWRQMTGGDRTTVIVTMTTSSSDAGDDAVSAMMGDHVSQSPSTEAACGSGSTRSFPMRRKSPPRPLASRECKISSSSLDGAVMPPAPKSRYLPGTADMVTAGQRSRRTWSRPVSGHGGRGDHARENRERSSRPPLQPLADTARGWRRCAECSRQSARLHSAWGR